MAIVAITAASVSAHGAEVRLLAADGMAAPVGSGVIFDSAVVGGPSLDPSGNVAFTFGVRGAASGAAVWLMAAGELQLVAGPDSLAAQRLTAFAPEISSVEDEDLVLHGASRIALLARHDGRYGLWEIDPRPGGQVRAVAIDGEAIPVSDTVPDGSFYFGIGGATGVTGNVAFRANQHGDLVFQASDDVDFHDLWLDVGGATTPVARVGQAAPGLFGGTYDDFVDFAVSDQRGVTFWANARLDDETRSGVWSTHGGSLAAVIVQQEEAEGAFAGVVGPMVFQQDGGAAFVGVRSERDANGDLEGVTTLYLMDPSGELTRPLDSRGAIGGARFDGFDALAIAEDLRMAGIARLTEDDGDTIFEALVIQHAVGGAFTIRQRLDGPAPDGGAGTIVSFGDVAFSDRAGLVAEARIQDGDDTRDVLYRSSSTVEPILSTGAVLSGAGGRQYTVAGFDLSESGRLAFNRDGTLCFQVRLGEGGSRGIACEGLSGPPPTGALELDLTGLQEATLGFPVNAPTDEPAISVISTSLKLPHLQPTPNQVYDFYLGFELAATSATVPTWSLDVTLSGPVDLVGAHADGDERACAAVDPTRIHCGEVEVTSAPLSPDNHKAVHLFVKLKPTFSGEALVVEAVAGGETDQGVGLEPVSASRSIPAALVDLALLERAPAGAGQPALITVRNAGARAVEGFELWLHERSGGFHHQSIEAEGVGLSCTAVEQTPVVYCRASAALEPGQERQLRYPVPERGVGLILLPRQGHGERDPDLSNNTLNVSGSLEVAVPPKSSGCAGGPGGSWWWSLLVMLFARPPVSGAWPRPGRRRLRLWRLGSPPIVASSQP